MLVYGAILNQFANTWNASPAPGALVTAWDHENAVVSGPILPTANGWTIQQAGHYSVSVNLSLFSPSVQRGCVAGRIAVNGAGIGPVSKSSYIRRASEHNSASTSWNWELPNLAVGDQVGVLVYRNGRAGLLEAPAGESSLCVRRIV